MYCMGNLQVGLIRLGPEPEALCSGRVQRVHEEVSKTLAVLDWKELFRSCWPSTYLKEASVPRGETIGLGRVFRILTYLGPSSCSLLTYLCPEGRILGAEGRPGLG